MRALLAEVRHNPLLWLLAFVPVVFAAESMDDLCCDATSCVVRLQ